MRVLECLHYQPAVYPHNAELELTQLV